jgi:hypothetical protein
LIIVVFGFIGLATDGTNLTFIRAFRVFRAMKSIQALPGLRVMVSALAGSLTAMGNIVFLIVSAVTVFAIFGLQLFVGSLRCKCVGVPAEFQVLEGNPELFSAYNWDSYKENGNAKEWVNDPTCVLFFPGGNLHPRMASVPTLLA